MADRLLRRVALALGVAALVVWTVPAAVAAEQLTKPAFIAAADKLCSDTDQYLGFVTLTLTDEGQDPLAPPSDAQIVEFSGYLVPSYRELIREIRALEEPKADRAKIKKFLKTLASEIDEIEDDPLVLRTSPVLPKSSGLAQRYGFEHCGAVS